MAYELRELGWHDEDIKSISSSISGQTMTITITLQDDSTVDTTVTLPSSTDTKVTAISNAIANNKLTTTVTLSDTTTITSAAVDLPAYSVYSLTIINTSGTLTETQYNALRADKSSYVIYKNSNDDELRLPQVLWNGDGNIYYGSTYGDILYSLRVAGDYTYSLTQTAKTISVSSASTDNQYPSAKAVYDYVQSAAGTDSYYIELSGTSGTITADQYTKLFADKNSYILYTKDSTQYKLTLAKYYPNASESSLSLEYSNTYEITAEGEIRIVYILANLSWNTQTKGLQDTNYKRTTISSTSDNQEYPTAKAVYTYGQSISTEVKEYTDTAIANAITTALNTPV